MCALWKYEFCPIVLQTLKRGQIETASLLKKFTSSLAASFTWVNNRWGVHKGDVILDKHVTSIYTSPLRWLYCRFGRENVVIIRNMSDKFAVHVGVASTFSHLLKPKRIGFSISVSIKGPYWSDIDTLNGATASTYRRHFSLCYALCR